MKLICENHTNSITYLTYPKGISDKFASCSEVNYYQFRMELLDYGMLIIIKLKAEYINIIIYINL